jgi:hypothetical protein
VGRDDERESGTGAPVKSKRSDGVVESEGTDGAIQATLGSSAGRWGKKRRRISSGEPSSG